MISIGLFVKADSLLEMTGGRSGLFRGKTHFFCGNRSNEPMKKKHVSVYYQIIFQTRYYNLQAEDSTSWEFNVWPVW